MNLNSSLQQVKGVGPKAAEQFAAAGISVISIGSSMCFT
jgi:predicted flap endonuclease-1-like 5' DNA nuclease